VCNLSIKLYHIYVCYMDITLYYVTYSIRYYRWFHVTALGLGMYYLWIQGSACSLAFGLWRWHLFLVLILRIEEFVWKISWLLIIKLINESTYWHGSGRIFNCLNRLLQQVLGCAPAIILIILFCKEKIFPLLEETRPKIIPYFKIEWNYAL